MSGFPEYTRNEIGGIELGRASVAAIRRPAARTKRAAELSGLLALLKT